MDAATTAGLVAEIAPHVEGARVIEVVSPGADCLLLELSGGRHRYLGAVTMKALPVLFLLESPERVAGGGEALPFAGQLKGSEIVSLAAPGGSRAAVRLRWTSVVGRTIERTLTIDLGRNPSLALVDAARADRTAQGPAPAGAGGVSTADVSPTVTTWHDDRGRLHARLRSAGRDDPAGDARQFDSLNAAACHMFRELWPALDVARRRDTLTRVIDRRLRRTRRAMDKVQAEIDDSGNAEHYRHMGRLLLARQDQVRRGRPSATVKDFDGTTDVTLELDPKAGPQQNAESFFRRARKAEKRSSRAPVRLGELEDKAGELESALEALDGASADELTELERRFTRKEQKVTGRKAPRERARFRTYHVSGGWEVLVGKSNRDNDVLTHQMARPDDLWFHVRQAAGSHVVLRKAGRKAEPDKQAILETAAIAAFHSKAGKSSKVSVCYTEKRHVRKARGGRPGEAVIAREKVVMVRPGLPES